EASVEQLDSPKALAAAIGEKLFALTEENVHAHNELLSAKSSQPRVRTVDGDFCFSENSSEANDDGESVAAMPKHLFEREERDMAIRELIEQMPTLKPVGHDQSGRIALLEEVCDGSPEEVERFLSGSRFVADAKDELYSHHPVIDSKLNPDDGSEYSDNGSEYSDNSSEYSNE
ncbi:hypothetical protein J7438_27435, partial [Thalassotalea sp. G20_0]|uniref:hypothetical protein n=1 Tax=Thalassotalea sp. G20_0 TaxID=2821093 RepID=UPI001ADAD1C9